MLCLGTCLDQMTKPLFFYFFFWQCRKDRSADQIDGGTSSMLSWFLFATQSRSAAHKLRDFSSTANKHTQIRIQNNWKLGPKKKRWCEHRAWPLLCRTTNLCPVDRQNTKQHPNCHSPPIAADTFRPLVGTLQV
jgi:hypothetical protein